ncbi:hypothetical protein [Microbispora sp. H13382]|uniref:hypothetical protein n=1 Tax=Microbispora sp. H13382 TaxID=2729112 RepID=UPI002872C5B7|nr:hypothetical protein [Microbispora sp. H13382]
MEPDDDVLDEEVLDELDELVEAAAASFLPESPDDFVEEDGVVAAGVDDVLDERLSVR